MKMLAHLIIVFISLSDLKGQSTPVPDISNIDSAIVRIKSIPNSRSSNVLFTLNGKFFRDDKGISIYFDTSNMTVSILEGDDAQKEISRYLKTKKPKAVKNFVVKIEFPEPHQFETSRTTYTQVNSSFRFYFKTLIVVDGKSFSPNAHVYFQKGAIMNSRLDKNANILFENKTYKQALYISTR